MVTKKQLPEIFRKLYAIHLTTKIVYLEKSLWSKNPLKDQGFFLLSLFETSQLLLEISFTSS